MRVSVFSSRLSLQAHLGGHSGSRRVHRIGQEKKVIAYRFVSEGSIDEKVLELQKEKRELAAILEDGVTSMVGSLTRENLEMLLS